MACGTERRELLGPDGRGIVVGLVAGLCIPYQLIPFLYSYINNPVKQTESISVTGEKSATVSVVEQAAVDGQLQKLLNNKHRATFFRSQKTPLFYGDIMSPK
jgi:hypothetical protein